MNHKPHEIEQQRVLKLSPDELTVLLRIMGYSVVPSFETVTDLTEAQAQTIIRVLLARDFAKLDTNGELVLAQWVQHQLNIIPKFTRLLDINHIIEPDGKQRLRLRRRIWFYQYGKLTLCHAPQTDETHILTTINPSLLAQSLTSALRITDKSAIPPAEKQTLAIDIHEKAMEIREMDADKAADFLTQRGIASPAAQALTKPQTTSVINNYLRKDDLSMTQISYVILHTETSNWMLREVNNVYEIDPISSNHIITSILDDHDWITKESSDDV